MVMSTRCSASLTVTLTPEVLPPTPVPARAANINGVGRSFAPEQPSRTLAAKPMAISLNMLIGLSSNDHLLGFFVEGDLLAALNRGHVHAQCNRMAVAGADAGVRRLAR